MAQQDTHKWQSVNHGFGLTEECDYCGGYKHDMMAGQFGPKCQAHKFDDMVKCTDCGQLYTVPGDPICPGPSSIFRGWTLELDGKPEIGTCKCDMRDLMTRGHDPYCPERPRARA